MGDMTPPTETFEYQELIVGIAHRRTGPVSFRRSTTPIGSGLEIGVQGSAMSLLNAEGAKGWGVVRENQITHEQHPWVVAELQEEDNQVISVSGTREYLLMRRVVD